MDSRQRFVNPPSAAKKAGELPPRLAMRTAEATDCESAPGDSLWAGSGHSLGSPVNASIMLAPMPERILVAQTNERPGRKERALLGSHTESEMAIFDLYRTGVTNFIGSRRCWSVV